MSELLYRCMTKAMTAEGDTVRRSLNWALARRGMLEVWTDALRFKDWRIPYAKIDEAVLHSVWQGLIPGFVLVLKSDGAIYQFGLNYGRFWKGDLPFAVERASGRVGFSWGSIALRVLLVAAAIYYLFSR